MDELLERHLRDLGLSERAAPSAAEWQRFLAAISEAYERAGRADRDARPNPPRSSSAAPRRSPRLPAALENAPHADAILPSSYRVPGFEIAAPGSS